MQEAKRSQRQRLKTLKRRDERLLNTSQRAASAQHGKRSRNLSRILQRGLQRWQFCVITPIMHIELNLLVFKSVNVVSRKIGLNNASRCSTGLGLLRCLHAFTKESFAPCFRSLNTFMFQLAQESITARLLRVAFDFKLQQQKLLRFESTAGKKREQEAISNYNCNRLKMVIAARKNVPFDFLCCARSCTTRREAKEHVITFCVQILLI